MRNRSGLLRPKVARCLGMQHHQRHSLHLYRMKRGFLGVGVVGAGRQTIC
jgi:hypothetical protein